MVLFDGTSKRKVFNFNQLMKRWCSENTDGKVINTDLRSWLFEYYEIYMKWLSWSVKLTNECMLFSQFILHSTFSWSSEENVSLFETSPPTASTSTARMRWRRRPRSSFVSPPRVAAHLARSLNCRGRLLLSISDCQAHEEASWRDAYECRWCLWV